MHGWKECNMPIPPLPKGKKERSYCRFFKKGRCTEGDKCIYIHDELPS